MATTIQDIENGQLRSGLPEFRPGDRVRVHFLVIEGNRKRPQIFEGVVIKRQGSGVRETFTVRKQSFGVGVERTFPLHSPKIEKLEVASRGRVRRAKLYYLRGRTGKAARVAERRWGIDDEVLAAGTEGAVDASGEGLAPEEVPEPAASEEVEGVDGAEEDASTGSDSTESVSEPAGEVSDDQAEADTGGTEEAASEAEPAPESDAGAEEAAGEGAGDAEAEEPAAEADDTESDPGEPDGDTN